MLWCEIGFRERTAFETSRFEKLNSELKALGLESSFELITCTPETLDATIETAKSRFDSIRFAGEAGTSALKNMTQVPAGIATLRTSDSLLKENGVWWPRCHLVDGINQTFAASESNIDIGGSVFILGAGSKARAVIAALSKIGFARINISDPDDEKSTALVEELKRSYFGVQFQQTPRNLVTQLPGVCSIAVNTVDAGEDAAGATELAYFNFLKTGGLWLDLALFPLNQNLQAEAVSVGGILLDGFEVLARTDALWLEALCSTKGTTVHSVDVSAYARTLAQV